jgi:hypothetical protein
VKAEAIRATDEPTVAVLDVDQAELALNPARTRVWAATGVPWEVETPGNNRKQVMFGAVNSRSGQTHFQLSAHKRSARLWRPAVRRSPNRPRLSAGGLHLLDRRWRQHLQIQKHTGLAQGTATDCAGPLPSYAPKLNLQEIGYTH